ncbi:hypothetical protein HanXRQr2_Chr17g0831521 [Helianthus annuus]|uniref:Uncharacterized protein n=1 Tax=Helianthus annuus TaxID=4232 RepID=A0A9K3GWU7_HELAN|nr:hypothetical protein HanXRQr2_Chr17g0831521 [Helianthus annuus]
MEERVARMQGEDGPNPDEDQAASKNRTRVKQSFRNVVSSLF